MLAKSRIASTPCLISRPPASITQIIGRSTIAIGAGGLGSPLLLYLAAAGIGTIGVVDDDVVDLSNLQRQVAHTTAAIGMPKVDSAAAAARALNPGVTIETHRTRLTAANALALVGAWRSLPQAFGRRGRGGADRLLLAWAVGPLALAHLGLLRASGLPARLPAWPPAGRSPFRGRLGSGLWTPSGAGMGGRSSTVSPSSRRRGTG